MDSLCWWISRSAGTADAGYQMAARPMLERLEVACGADGDHSIPIRLFVVVPPFAAVSGEDAGRCARTWVVPSGAPSRRLRLRANMRSDITGRLPSGW